MARFKYSMQSILDIKMKMESQAKLLFAEAVNYLDEQNKELEQLYDRRKEYEKRHIDLLSGTLNIREIDDNKNAILKMDEYIASQRKKVAEAEQNVEKQREALAEIMTDRKAHETMREKAFESFLKEENRIESKSVDELTSYVYGQKKAGE